MPAWRQGAAVGEWRQIPNSALSAAPMAVQSEGATGPISKVIAWTGFTIDTRDSSVYSAANGGHMDYAGNEVNRLRLSDNAPAWSEPRAATAPSQVTISSTHYADGRPTARHTYYGTTLNEVRGRIMLIGGARYGNGVQLLNTDGFNLSSNDWDPAGTFPNSFDEITRSDAMAVADNKSTGDLYVFAQWNVLRWSNATNTWSRALTNTRVYGHGAAAAMDTRRNRVFVLGGQGGDMAFYDPAANTLQTVSLSGPYASSAPGTGAGMVYDVNLDAFLVRQAGGGGAVYRIDAQTLNVDLLATSGGASIPGSSNNVYTRFLYAPKLKGIVYFPSYGTNGWFLRTF